VHFSFTENHSSIPTITKANRAALLSKCANIHTAAGPPPSFRTATRIREGSDRWVPGTPSTLLRNARIWIGARNGTEVVYGDVLFDKGLIVAVGYIPPNLLAIAKASGAGDVRVLDVAGKWITPGLVDLHSHIGVYSLPSLKGISLFGHPESYLSFLSRCNRWELAQGSHPALASKHRRAKHP